ncbi:hypothetical protein D9613_010215 [Agrocybe pediades]|uniref:Uncharacterized protein n=1 Tax=Agrocybe pediades TaxID=84607 RepID=A0A8H4QG85_9AGAR|nr:hypothetical protein D9613_010215 [Agrocybe pediades]
MVYGCLIDAKPEVNTNQPFDIFDHLSAATFSVAAATSFVATGVICLQIWQHSTLRSRSRKHYRTIIRALIESSALYTVAVLCLAILNFTNTGSFEKSLETYTIFQIIDAATQIISGLAPTLMIARLFVSSEQEDPEVSSARLPSDLIDGRVSHATDANMANMGTDLEMQQGGSIGIGERESEEIQAVPRNEYYGQPEGQLQDGVNTVVV